MAARSDVPVGQRRLPGFLEIPSEANALVIFVHGSGSSRLSPRNAYAAAELRKQGFATLLFDLLTQEESADRGNVFDIGLLAARVVDAIEGAVADRRIRDLPIGLFGASTGAAAAIAAAVKRPADVFAVVSRGGRPDLAGEALPLIAAPTLLIVGGEDREVLALNERARARMRCESALVIVPGAGHLFEEPGTLDQALDAARAWFAKHVRGDRHAEAAVR